MLNVWIMTPGQKSPKKFVYSAESVENVGTGLNLVGRNKEFVAYVPHDKIHRIENADA